MEMPTAKFAGKIRHAQREDSARIAELATQLGYPSSRDEIVRRLAEMQGSDDSDVFVAQLAGGETRGGSVYSFLVPLWMSPAWRSAGWS